ncbi:hypothetical protein M2336_001645 [Sphingobium sp. B1D7B]|uniref:hypothetical protein n=1 Tax=Sphingobium sp. B1D7B TaxID=2940578 RepID=UPI0022255C23|nr:hypothetical protein [Sphingobium sp. B1D7B]MCW2405016.1 hypothetical protein [Sphingobium sp. B1D7B]
MRDKKKPYIRQRPDGAELRFMAAAEGYVMARRKGAMPTIIPVNEWNSWTELKP